MTIYAALAVGRSASRNLGLDYHRTSRKGREAMNEIARLLKERY
jgi:hypothetical protein